MFYTWRWIGHGQEVFVPIIPSSVRDSQDIRRGLVTFISLELQRARFLLQLNRSLIIETGLTRHWGLSPIVPST